MTRRTLLAGAAALPIPAREPAAWPQWGGPNRNFTAPSAGVESSWPKSGPKVIWRRPLGEGFSAPSIEGRVVYTMHGARGKEIVSALDASTGKTIWEHATPVSFESQAPENGDGPYAAPLIAGSRVFTAGADGRLQCLDKTSGKVLWTQLLWSDHGGTRLVYGYASSPVAFRDLVIAPVGAKGKATMAFRQTDGAIAWAKGSIANVYSSPVIVSVDGLDQLVQVMDGLVFALNPHNGDLQWQIPFRAQYGIVVATPLWCPGNLLFVSAEYGAGSKMIRLSRAGMRINAEEVWSSSRLRLHHGNAMCIDGVLYFTNGGKGSQAILTAIDSAKGTVLWQERSIEKATFVWADNKLITLDQDGVLMLANPTPKGFEVLAKAELMNGLSWTPPALVGTTLYLRDRKSIMAVALG